MYQILFSLFVIDNVGSWELLRPIEHPIFFAECKTNTLETSYEVTKSTQIADSQDCLQKQLESITITVLHYLYKKLHRTLSSSNMEIANLCKANGRSQQQVHHTSEAPTLEWNIC